MGRPEVDRRGPIRRRTDRVRQRTGTTATCTDQACQQYGEEQDQGWGASPSCSGSAPAQAGHCRAAGHVAERRRCDQGTPTVGHPSHRDSSVSDAVCVGCVQHAGGAANVDSTQVACPIGHPRHGAGSRTRSAPRAGGRPATGGPLEPASGYRGQPATQPAPAPSSHSPTAWCSWNSPTGCHPAQTRTRPGGKASPRSSHGLLVTRPHSQLGIELPANGEDPLWPRQPESDRAAIAGGAASTGIRPRRLHRRRHRPRQALDRAPRTAPCGRTTAADSRHVVDAERVPDRAGGGLVVNVACCAGV